MAKKSKRTQKVLAQIKAQRGFDRKHYFDEGDLESMQRLIDKVATERDG